MAVDPKSFISIGLFSKIFADGLIVSVDQTKFNPNGILDGEWGHYTDDDPSKAWISGEPSVLTVLTNEIKRDGYFMFGGDIQAGTPAVLDSLIVGEPLVSKQFNISAKDKIGRSFYVSGLTTDTKTLYKWIKKVS